MIRSGDLVVCRRMAWMTGLRTEAIGRSFTEQFSGVESEIRRR